MKRTARPLALLSGVLLVLIFPWYDVEWLAWIAFVPLLLATRGVRPGAALWWGWLAGCLGYLGILRWIPNTMIHYGGVPAPVSYAILLLLVAYVALYVGAFAAGWAWLVGRWPHGVWLFVPALWVTLEWVRAHALSGFPWASLGYSQYRNRPLIQMAEVTGVYGVSFVLVLGNVALAQCADAARRRSWRAIALPGALTAAGLLAIWGVGLWRLQRWQPSESTARPTLHVALIQGNIDQGQKWDRAAQESIFASYGALTREAAAPEVALIVWPEASTPFFFANDPVFRARQLGLVREEGRPLLFGSPTHAREAGQDIMYNSAFLVGPDATVWGRYDKIHLVPFGEYIPLRSLLFFLEKLVEGIGDFRSGTRYTVMAIPQGRFSVLICYEAIFPDLVRQFVRQGAQFLVNITNDAWFGRSPAPYQHLSMVVFRAIEHRVPIVRAANTGISALIDPTGRLVQQTDLFTRAWITGRIAPVENPATFYTRVGDVFAYACLLLTALGLAGSIVHRRRRRARREQGTVVMQQGGRK